MPTMSTSESVTPAARRRRANEERMRLLIQRPPLPGGTASARVRRPPAPHHDHEAGESGEVEKAEEGPEDEAVSEADPVDEADGRVATGVCGGLKFWPPPPSAFWVDAVGDDVAEERETARGTCRGRAAAVAGPTAPHRRSRPGTTSLARTSPPRAGRTEQPRKSRGAGRRAGSSSPPTVCRRSRADTAWRRRRHRRSRSTSPPAGGVLAVGTMQDWSTAAVQPLPPSWSRPQLRRQRPGAGDGVAVLFEVPPTRPLTVFPRVLVTPPRRLLLPEQEPRRPSRQPPAAGLGVAVGDEVVVFVVVVVVEEDDGDGLTVAAALAFGAGVEVGWPQPMIPRMQPVLGMRGRDGAVPVTGGWEGGWGRGMPSVSTPVGTSKTCVPAWQVTGSAWQTCWPTVESSWLSVWVSEESWRPVDVLPSPPPSPSEPSCRRPPVDPGVAASAVVATITLLPASRPSGEGQRRCPARPRCTQESPSRSPHG